MYKVTYKIFGKYVNEKTFDTYETAKKFFYVMVKNSKATSVELETI